MTEPPLLTLEGQLIHGYQGALLQPDLTPRRGDWLLLNIDALILRDQSRVTFPPEPLYVAFSLAKAPAGLMWGAGDRVTITGRIARWSLPTPGALPQVAQLNRKAARLIVQRIDSTIRHLAPHAPLRPALSKLSADLQRDTLALAQLPARLAAAARGHTPALSRLIAQTTKILRDAASAADRLLTPCVVMPQLIRATRVDILHDGPVAFGRVLDRTTLTDPAVQHRLFAEFLATATALQDARRLPVLQLPVTRWPKPPTAGAGRREPVARRLGLSPAATSGGPAIATRAPLPTKAATLTPTDPEAAVLHPTLELTLGLPRQLPLLAADGTVRLTPVVMARVAWVIEDAAEADGGATVSFLTRGAAVALRFDAGFAGLTAHYRDTLTVTGSLDQAQNLDAAAASTLERRRKRVLAALAATLKAWHDTTRRGDWARFAALIARLQAGRLTADAFFRQQARLVAPPEAAGFATCEAAERQLWHDWQAARLAATSRVLVLRDLTEAAVSDSVFMVPGRPIDRTRLADPQYRAELFRQWQAEARRLSQRRRPHA
ncbi:hypothetical protein [Lacticaseibacillus parakribbianus]|uniref:hypothetical protein n=1 Tax=Lacticaseibacillus parakribbianus TaxID=2970927 RepID=UPI0021CB9418|nr:hypothetical protein [Lacticaseibacillus parakribbianus]